MSVGKHFDINESQHRCWIRSHSQKCITRSSTFKGKRMNHDAPIAVLTDRLQCLLHAECQIGFALLNLFEQTSHTTLRELISESMNASDRHACKLLGVFNRLGAVPRTARSPITEMIRDCEDGPDRNAMGCLRQLMIVARFRRLQTYKLHEYEFLHHLTMGYRPPQEGAIFGELLHEEILVARKLHHLIGDVYADFALQFTPAGLQA
ncbi:MAG: DUF892 family protein [Verrucomicrobiales bacterium]